MKGKEINQKALRSKQTKPNRQVVFRTDKSSDDLFSTLYGNEQAFRPKKEFAYIPNYSKYSDDSEIRQVQNAVIPLNLQFNNNPKVVIPNAPPLLSPRKISKSQSNLLKNTKSQFFQELSPRRQINQRQALRAQKPPPTPSTTPRISNDHLAMFDDEEFDDPKIIESIISRIDSGETIHAESLYYYQNHKCEWRKCVVIGYNKPYFVIKFDSDADKTKEVPRIVLKFDIDDPNRFADRREQATSNRIETDTQLRLETYLYTRALKNSHHKIDTEIYKNIAKRLKPSVSKYSRSNNNSIRPQIINQLFQEVHSTYLYAEALGEFIMEWEDEKSAAKFIKSGLTPYKIDIKQWKNSPSKIQLDSSFSLPNQILIQQVVAECESYRNFDFLIELFKNYHPPVQLSYFFEQLKFELDTILANARMNLSTKLIELLKSITEEMDIYACMKLEQMINLRYKETLSFILNSVFVNCFELFLKYKISIDVRVDSDLETFQPTIDGIEQFGIERFEQMKNVFTDDSLFVMIDVYAGKLAQPLNVTFDYLSENYEKVKKQFKELLYQDFEIFKQKVNEIREITKNIPLNPTEAFNEIFSDEVKQFTEDTTNENIDFNALCSTIDFESIKNKLINAKADLNRFYLLFTEKLHLTILFIDNSEFYKLVLANYNEFYQLIFKKIESLTHYRIKEIDGIVSKLNVASTKSSSTVEDWYIKHCTLLQLKTNIHEIDLSIKFVMKIIDFMSDFQYQPKLGYDSAYQLKKKLYTVFSSIEQYMKIDQQEKEKLIRNHLENINILTKELEDFQVEIMKFHFIEFKSSDYQLLVNTREKYDRYIEQVNLYKSRDSKLEIQETEYGVFESINKELLTIVSPIWTIGYKLDTEVEHWLSVPFRELNLPEMTSILIDWRNSLENIKRNEYGDNQQDDYLLTTIDNHLIRLKSLIQHLPIVTCLCNKHLRGRHWVKINSLTEMPIDINEGQTWHWLVESGVEKHMLGIEAISRNADCEFQIETALVEMVEELRTMRLQVNEENGVLRLENPSIAMMMLARHQEKMKEIFIPPHIHPFLARINDYDLHATNLRDILKQTLEAQKKIDELKLAMDSDDIRTQHEEMAEKFDVQLQKFNEFTKSFQISLSFYQLVNNRRYVDISAELEANFKEIRNSFDNVLAKKRKIFARFNFLSDSQLISLISNSMRPSAIKTLISFMYSSIKELLLEDEKFVIGFISKSGEQFIFEKKVKITSESIEKWHIEFDKEIKETMKFMTQKLLAQPSTNLEKSLVSYPVQVICLVFEMIFTTNITKQFDSFESNFLPNKQELLLNGLQAYSKSLNKEISFIYQLFKKIKLNQFSALILTYLNQIELLNQMINCKIDSSTHPLWYSYMKYYQKNTDSFSIVVQMGPISFDYGFEYTGLQRPLIKQQPSLMSSFMLSSSNSIVPLVYSNEDINVQQISELIHHLGFNPLIYPCYSYTTIERINEVVNCSQECNEFLIIQGLNQLSPEIRNEFSLQNYFRERNWPLITTYSYFLNDNRTLEQLKLYYRPLQFSVSDLENKYELILESLSIDNHEYLASRFSYLSHTISSLFEPPISTILMENSIIEFITNHPMISAEELVQEFIIYVKSYLFEYDLSSILEYIYCIFSDLEIDFDPEIESKSEDGHLMTFQSHRLIIVLGNAMTGKTTLIETVANKSNKKLIHINPHSISLHILYGNKTAGLLSSLLIENGTESHWLVFDGSCKNDWMEPISYALNSNNQMFFGDSSKIQFSDDFKFIFETDDISMISPTILGQCTTIYIDDSQISTEAHLKRYLVKLSNENKIIEPLSKTIVASSISSDELTSIFESFYNHFVQKLIEYVDELNCCLGISKIKLFLNHFFEYFHSSLLNYYVVENNHSADELLSDSPHLLLFALFWAFSGSYDNKNRIRINEFILNLAKEFPMVKLPEDPFFSLIDFYYDDSSHEWKKWIEKEKELLNLLNFSPDSIFIPTEKLTSTLSIMKNLVKQDKNILLFSDKSSHVQPYIDTILSSNYFISKFSSLSFNVYGDISLRNILQNFLNDQQGANGLSMNAPLISLIGFDITSGNCNSELLRFLMEHKYYQNSKTLVCESIPTLRFILTTDKEMNSRLAHFCFLLNIEQDDNEKLKSTLSNSIQMNLKIISSVSDVVSSCLIDTFTEVNSIAPQFDFITIRLIFQHMYQTINSNYTVNPVEFIYNELHNYFYNSTHNSSILEILTNAKKELSGKITQPTIKEILSIPESIKIPQDNIEKDMPNDEKDNIENDTINEVNMNDNIDEKEDSVDEVNKIKLNDEHKTLLENVDIGQLSIGSLEPIKQPEKKEKLQEIENKDFDSLSQLLTTERCNVVLKCDHEKLPEQIIEKVCQNNNCILYKKQLNDSLIKVFHDHFIEAGMTKKHIIIYAVDTYLNSTEMTLLKLILKNNNIYGLFEKGESMKLMTELEHITLDSLNDDSAETTETFNSLYSEFVSNATKFCHFVILQHSYSTESFDNAVSFIINETTVHDEQIDQLKERLIESHICDDFPYLFSAVNLDQILIKTEERVNTLKEKIARISNRRDVLFETKRINDSFLQINYVKIQNTESDIKQLNEELKTSMEVLQNLQKISEEQTAAFEKEADAIKVEQIKVQNLRKECELQLQETKAILETATHEVKQLSSRDTAVIKALIHPPEGVVLVVIAICIVMDIGINYSTNATKEEIYTKSWELGKRVMNDPSFLTKLISSALDSLSPTIIQKLTPIVRDPNFEPEIIEKSSSAAKSICKFIRSLIPYYDALVIYKDKNAQMMETEANFEILVQKQNEAMEKLALSRKKCIENQAKIDKLLKTKISYEDQLFDQSERMKFYSKFQEQLDKYIKNQLQDFSEKLDKKKQQTELLFIKQVYRDLCGPLTDNTRNELYDQINLREDKQSRESILLCENPLVRKWNKLNYPVSLFWKENTAILAPEAGRWVIVEGLRCCSNSFLKKIMNVPTIATFSVQSKTFEEEFLHSVQTTNRIIVTDYDFNEPSLIITLVYQVLKNNSSFVYKTKEIFVKQDLIVYFDVDKLPSQSYLTFDAVMINLRVGSQITTEQIALSLFNGSSYASDLQLNEQSIFETNENIKQTEEEIETLLNDNRIQIFHDKTLQRQYNEKMNKLNDLVKTLKELKDTHVTLFESFPIFLNTASELCQEFEKYPIQTSIWRLYDNYHEANPFAEISTIKTYLQSVVLSSLPPKIRMVMSPSDYHSNHQDVLLITSSSRPTMIYSPTSSFALTSLVHHLKINENAIIYHNSGTMIDTIEKSMMNGQIVIVMLNSLSDLLNSIQSVSFVLSQNTKTRQFRLFLFATFPFNREDDVLMKKISIPSLFTFCDTIYCSPLLNTKSIFNNLTQTEADKRLATFHSVLSIIKKFKYGGEINHFSDYLYSRGCLDVNKDEENTTDLLNYNELFVTQIIYGLTKPSIEIIERLWNQEINELDDPKSFGLNQKDFDYYKQRFIPTRMIGNDKEDCFVTLSPYDLDEQEDYTMNHFRTLASIDLSDVSEIPPLLNFEFMYAQTKLKHVADGTDKITPLFRYEINQLINLPKVLDLSLFVSIDIFINAIKSEYLKKIGKYETVAIVIEDPKLFDEDGSLCKGIICIGGQFQDGVFMHSDENNHLSEFWVKPVPMKELDGFRPVSLFKDGKIVEELFIRFDGDSHDFENLALITSVI